MKTSIIFVIATFGGILALGLTVNAIKKRNGTQPCFVQVEAGTLTPCQEKESTKEKGQSSEGAENELSWAGEIHGISGSSAHEKAGTPVMIDKTNPRETREESSRNYGDLGTKGTSTHGFGSGSSIEMGEGLVMIDKTNPMKTRDTMLYPS